MGDPITGGTIYSLNSSKCDSGDILLQRILFIRPEWDYHEIWKRLFPIGVDMVSKAVSIIERGAAEYTPQDEMCATWEPSWDRPRLQRNELPELGVS